MLASKQMLQNDNRFHPKSTQGAQAAAMEVRNLDKNSSMFEDAVASDPAKGRRTDPRFAIIDPGKFARSMTLHHHHKSNQAQFGEELLTQIELLDCTGQITHRLILLFDGTVAIDAFGRRTIVDPRSRTVLTPGHHVNPVLMDQASTLANT